MYTYVNFYPFIFASLRRSFFQSLNKILISFFVLYYIPTLNTIYHETISSIMHHMWDILFYLAYLNWRHAKRNKVWNKASKAFRKLPVLVVNILMFLNINIRGCVLYRCACTSALLNRICASKTQVLSKLLFMSFWNGFLR